LRHIPGGTSSRPVGDEPWGVTVYPFSRPSCNNAKPIEKFRSDFSQGHDGYLIWRDAYMMVIEPNMAMPAAKHLVFHHHTTMHGKSSYVDSLSFVLQVYSTSNTKVSSD
jgi:hypothetical protein